MFTATHWLAARAGFEDLQMSLVQKAISLHRYRKWQRETVGNGGGKQSI